MSDLVSEYQQYQDATADEARKLLRMTRKRSTSRVCPASDTEAQRVFSPSLVCLLAAQES